jgi:hypothetical protein
MNAKVLALLSVASIAASLVAGCSAAPPGPDAEATASTSEALPVGSSSGGGCVGPKCFHGWDCGGTVPLNPHDPQDFEQGLIGLKCGDKQAYHPYGTGAIYVSQCPTWTTFFWWCPRDLAFETMNVWQYAECWANAPPISAGYYTEDVCNNNKPISSNYAELAFDPNCGDDCGSLKVY